MTTEEKIRTQCTACGQRMRLKSKHVGKAISCPTCKETFVVTPLEDGEATGSELPAASGTSADSPWGDESQEAGNGAASPMEYDQREDDMASSIPPGENDEHGDEAEGVDLQALTAASIAEDDDGENLEEFPEPAEMDDEDGATVSDPPGVTRGRRRGGEAEEVGAPLSAKVTPSKYFEPLLSQEEAAQGEFKIGRAGLLTPEQTRLLVTDKNLYTHRTRRMLFGLVPGADVWTAAYPLDSTDLRRLRIRLPSVGRMLLVFLLAILIGGLAFFAMFDMQQQADGQDRLLISAADFEGVSGSVAEPIAQWFLNEARAFDLENFGTWYGTLIPLLLAFLWYAWRFKARLESDAFNLPLGRGKKKVTAARDAMHLILQHRARLQNRRGM